MGNILKTLLAIGVVAGGAAAVMAYKKRKELEDYDYEDLDDDFDDCLDEDTTPEEDLEKVEDEVEDVDLADKVGEAADDAAEKVSDAAEDLAEKAEEAVEAVEEKAEELKDFFTDDDK
ncbi:hypothetical protein [Ruminococcus sp.]|uniref:hypothetical protein n=1 Tax=Ruminococcus sp. TaxID=41978 RepID=UPI0025DB5E72|nr:hypothetical protein [Ruminococcus sp.]MBQ8966749.1 hypothetical protein [Ruminococcus sp.]